MTKQKISDFIIGIVLFGIGVWILGAQFNLFPIWEDIFKPEFQWPYIVIGIGVFLFLLGLVTRNTGLSIPACIVGGIGGILLWTNSTGNWGAWSYLWTLIPGFVGFGTIFSTLLGEDKHGYLEGLRLIVVSLILLAMFLFLFSGNAYLFRYWPILIILFGVWIIIQSILHKK